MKKTILTVISTILILLIIVIIANFIRNVYLLKGLINKNYIIENYKYTLSSYTTIRPEEASYVKFYKKENKGKEVAISGNGEIHHQIFSDNDTNKNYLINQIGEILTDNLEGAGLSKEVPSIKYFSDYPTFNIYSYSLTHIIPTVDIKGRDCIPIELEHELYYIEKDTGYLVRYQTECKEYSDGVLTDGYSIMDYSSIQQNVVTDEDVALPETVQ